MALDITTFFDNLANGARWDVGVSINRSNALPLDANSVFSSLSDAQSYVAGTLEGVLANAYPGQILAVVTEDETIVYYVDANMTLQPVGNTKDVMAYIGEIPEGSDADTIIEYINAKTAGIATDAALKELQDAVTDLNVAIYGREADEEAGIDEVTGLIEDLRDITLELNDLSETYNIDIPELRETIGSSKDTAETETVYGAIAKAKSEAIEEAANQSAVVLSEAQRYADAAVTAGVAGKADKADTLAGYGITDAYTKTETDTAIATAIAGQVHMSTEIVESLEAITEPKAGVIYLVADANAEAGTYLEYILVEHEGAAATLELIGSTKTDLSDYITTSELTTALDPYAKIADVVVKNDFETFKTENTQSISDARIGAVADVAAVGYALETSVASRLSEKADKTALNDYYTAAEIDSKGYAVAETVNNELAKKIETAQIRHTSEGVGEGVTKDGTALTITVDAYRKSEVYTKSETDAAITAKINSVTGGESAADVKLALEDYRDALNSEIWGDDAAAWTTRITDENGKTVVTYNPQYGSTSRVDALADKVGSAKVGEEGEEGYKPAKGLFALVGNAQTTADAAASQASQNAGAIDGLKTAINGDSGLAARIGALEQADITHDTAYQTLKGRVDTLTTETIPAINVTLGTHTDDIAALKVTLNGKPESTEGAGDAVEGLVATVAKKANAADVYIKDEVDAKVITSGAVVRGTADSVVIANNTITVTLNSYTKGEVDTAISTAIGNIDNTAITNNSADIAVLVGDDKNAETGRANKSIRVIAAEEVAKIVDGAPEALDTLAEIAAWIVDDNTGAAAVVEDIAKHEAILTGFGGENQPKTVIAAIATAKQEAIAAIPVLEVATAEKLGGIKSAADTVTGEGDEAVTTVVENKVYVNAETAVAEVKAININTLVQTDGDVLILNGGSAAI